MAALQEQALHDRDAVDPDLAAPMARIVARSGGEAEYTAFLDLVRHPATPQEEIRYLYALAEFQHTALVRRTLDLALSEVRTQNAPFLVAAMLGNRIGGELAWEYTKEHWADITARFPDNLVPRMVQGATNLLKPEVAADVATFVASQPRLRDNKVVQQALEQLEINVAFARTRGRHAARRLHLSAGGDPHASPADGAARARRRGGGRRGRRRAASALETHVAHLLRNPPPGRDPHRIRQGRGGRQP